MGVGDGSVPERVRSALRSELRSRDRRVGLVGLAVGLLVGLFLGSVWGPAGWAGAPATLVPGSLARHLDDAGVELGRRSYLTLGVGAAVVAAGVYVASLVVLWRLGLSGLVAIGAALVPPYVVAVLGELAFRQSSGTRRLLRG